MMVAGGIPSPLAPPFYKSRVSSAPLLSIQSSEICVSSSPLPFPVPTLSARRSLASCLFAQNKHTIRETVQDEDDFFAVDGCSEDDDDDATDDLNVVVPFEELDEYLERKPLGFGEGKVYDTSIEDELLEEIENARRAQLANIAKLKSLSLEPQKQLDSEAVSNGVCVRISHLPKKRNVHRDLKAAFRGISGILSILPVVFGNKKTKDPICKGLAFVYFNSLENGNRFTDKFSTQTIPFGKIEKRIKCEIVDNSNNVAVKTPLNIPTAGRHLPLDGLSNKDNGIVENVESSSSASERDKADPVEQIMKSSSAASVPSKRASVQVNSSAKKKEKKNSMPKVPGAAKRLKLREKAMLADVFSRYGSGVASASKQS